MKTITTIIFLLIAGNAFGQIYVGTSANYSNKFDYQITTGYHIDDYLFTEASYTYNNKISNTTGFKLQPNRINYYFGITNRWNFDTRKHDFISSFRAGLPIHIFELQTSYNFSYIQYSNYWSASLLIRL